MKSQKVLSRWIPVALSSLLTACSGYTTSLSLSSVNGAFSESSAQLWNKLSVSGEVSGGRFDKRSVLRLDKEKKELVLSLPMAANAHIDGTQAAFPLSKITGASLEVDAIEGGGSILTLHVPLASLLDPDKFSTPTKLPNGKKLPYATDGELPAETLAIPDVASTGVGLSATIYLGKNIVGLYVTLPLNPLSELDNPIRSADSAKVWGSLHTYPASCLKCKDGGLFTAVQIPTDIAHLIEENL